MKFVYLIIALGMLTSGCTEDPVETPLPSLPIPALGEGMQFTLDVVAPPNEELWKCHVYPLDTSDFIYVNSVESIQNEGMHHMTISAIDFRLGVEIEEGWYDCAELYEEYMGSFVMVYGAGVSAAHESLTLPEGVVAAIPPGVSLMHEVHYVNVSEKEEALFSRVNAYTIPLEDVTDYIFGGSIRDETIHLPPQETTSEWTRCVMNKDIDLHFMASHTHALGIEFTAALFDGENTGEVFYKNNDWHDPYIQKFETPIHIPAGQGFEYKCTWNNPTNEVIGYGSTAAHEMCNLTIVHTPGDQDIECKVVETSDGVLWEKP